VLYKSDPDSPQGLLRRLCRNPLCRGELAAPTHDRLKAFCCEACFRGFFKIRCVVCEASIARKNTRQRVCRRAKCRSEFRAHKAHFSVGCYHPTPLAENSTKKRAKSKPKTALKVGRPIRKIAGPDLPEENFHIPLWPELVERLNRIHAALIERDRKAKWHAARRAVIKRHIPPANVLGGYKFPDAPDIDLSRP
jgi:hypothetical protein